MAETTPIRGIFSANIRKEGKVEVKKIAFRPSHPPHLHGSQGRSLHVETLIKIANGEKVDVEDVKKYSLEGFDKDSAQAELQHLADIGYLYLAEVKDPSVKTI